MSNCPSLFLYGNRKQNRHTLVCIFPLFWLYCTQQCVSTDIFYLSFSNSHSPTLSLSLCRSFSQYSAGNRNINKILSCWGVGLKHPQQGLYTPIKTPTHFCILANAALCLGWWVSAVVTFFRLYSLVCNTPKVGRGKCGRGGPTSELCDKPIV